MLQENLAFFKCCNVKCCKLFSGTKIVANRIVANFLGKFALLQKPIVAKKKPMGTLRVARIQNNKAKTQHVQD